jgi:hypothetical protein
MRPHCGRCKMWNWVAHCPSLHAYAGIVNCSLVDMLQNYYLVLRTIHGYSGLDFYPLPEEHEAPRPRKKSVKKKDLEK